MRAGALPSRLLRRAARVALVLLVALAAPVLLVIACANLPWSRAWLAREASALVSKQIAGTLRIQELARIGFGSVAGVQAELTDAAGHRVLAVSGLTVELDAWRAARSLLIDGALELAVTRLAADTLSADLHSHDAGELGLVSALDTSAGEAGPGTSGNGAPLELELHSIQVREIRVHAAPAPLVEAELELRDLAARVRLDGDGLHCALGHVRIEARGLPVVATLSGELEGLGTLPLGTEAAAPLELNAAWRGQVAEIPVETAVVLEGRQLSGMVRARAPTPVVRRLWTEGNGASSEVSAPVAARLAFEGTLDDLALRGVVQSGEGELAVDARLDLGQLSGRATVSGAALDLSTWLPAAPLTSLGFLGTLRFAHQHDTLTGRLELRSGRGSVAGRPLPGLAISARLEPRSLAARLDAELPGARAELELELPRGAASGQFRVPVELNANVSDLAPALAALDLPAAGLYGRGRVHARGTLQLGGEPVLHDGRLRAELRSFGAGAVSVARATVLASAEGALVGPQLMIKVDSRRVSLPGYPLDSLRVLAQGSPERLLLRARLDPQAAAPVRLTARLSPAAGRLSRIELSAGKGREAVQASVRALRSTRTGYALEGVMVRAAGGRLTLDAALRGSALHVDARSTAFSPAALARGLGLDIALPEGRADVSLQLDHRAGRTSGTLSGSVTRLRVGSVHDATLRLDLEAKRGVLRGLAGLSAMPVGELLLHAQAIVLPRRWAPAALVAFEGRLELLASADLGELRVAAGSAFVSGSELRGALQARLSVRGDGRAPPRTQLVLATRGLALAAPVARDAPSVGPEQAIGRWQDVDVELHLDLADARVRAQAALIGIQRSVLAHLRGSAPLPLERLLREPAAFDPRVLPVDIEVEVPKRKLGEFPAPLRFLGVNGTVQANASARGALGRPELAAHVELTELRLENGQRSLPLRVVADARLKQDELSASAAIRDVRRKLVSIEASATLSELAQPDVRDLALDLRSNGLPLDALGALLGQELAGELYGSVQLRTRGGQPAAEGTLWVNAPSFRGFRQKRARWELQGGPDAFSTALTLEQQDGRAHLRLGGPWRWRAALPIPDPQHLHAELHAERFELRALGPLLPEQARGVGGRLDADLVLDPEGAQAASGTAMLSDGRVYVAALGQEFRDIEMYARLAASGQLAIERFSARALNGRLSARGNVQLDGLALREATLDLNIPRADPLPVMLEGVTVATVWGRVDLSATGVQRQGEGRLLAVQVKLPRLQVVLPQLRPQGVQDIADEPTIEVGTFLSDGRFVSLPLPPYESQPDRESEALVVRVRVELGDEVWVEQEPMLELKVVGAIELELLEELTVEGQLRLARGSIDVQGRTFQIERGEITFVPSREPTNPTVVATGVYNAPEGTRVYAEFVGPVETGKLSLRSEPPLRDDQILSLLLFGTTDGSFGAATAAEPGDPLGTVGGTALVASGNALARGLSVELRRLTSLDIQTRIGEREGEPQPEVAVQLTPRLTAELAYRLQAPTPGRAPDRTYLTLDLRLLRNWFLSTTLGDAGSFVLELLWRYRY